MLNSLTRRLVSVKLGTRNADGRFYEYFIKITKVLKNLHSPSKDKRQYGSLLPSFSTFGKLLALAVTTRRAIFNCSSRPSWSYLKSNTTLKFI